MTVLRIFLAGDEVCDWSLDPPGGNAPGAGAAAFAALPRADVLQVVVPAARMRTLLLDIPPAPAAKVPAVVRFALEDQLAGDVDVQHIVIAAQRERTVVVHVIDRHWLQDTLALLARRAPRPSRIVAESDLVPAAADAVATWVWRADGGFLVQADGRVRVLDQSAEALPSGLLLALADAPAGARVVVRGPPLLSGQCAAWSGAMRMAFELAPEWSWRDAAPAAIAGARNLLTPDLERSGPRASTPSRRPWRRALGWLLAALLLHAGASTAEWTMLTLRAASIERETRAFIVAAAPALAAGTGSELTAAWRRHYAAARHRAGRVAPDDALPLLAQAAAGLRELPAGALRTINYESGQLTLDFEPAASATLATAATEWRAQGLGVLQAQTASGLRVRVTRQ